MFHARSGGLENAKIVHRNGLFGPEDEGIVHHVWPMVVGDNDTVHYTGWGGLANDNIVHHIGLVGPDVEGIVLHVCLPTFDK